MKRNPILSVLPMLLISLPLAAKPNVLFVLMDDLGHGDIALFRQINGAAPNALITPNLDRMGAEGMVLNRHYTAAPICAPARGTLLTGLHQGHANIRDKHFDRELEDNWNIGNTMQAAGYYTATVGKWGQQGGDRVENTEGSLADWSSYPTKRGFDYYYGVVRHRDGHLHYPAHYWEIGDVSPLHTDPKEVWENNEEVSSGLQKCYTTDLFGARAKQLMIEHTEQSPEQPFFIYLAFSTPHAALQVPPTAYPEGSGLNGGLEWIGEPGRMINTAEGEVDSFYYPAYREMNWSNEMKRFATMITRIDQVMGDLLQTLRDLDIAENTLVVFTSDNGPHDRDYILGGNYSPSNFESYSSFTGIKQDVLEGGYRVPTIVWQPGTVQAGVVDNTPSQFHDWMATLIDISGNPIPARADGVSLAPTLFGSGIQELNTVYTEFHATGATPDFAGHNAGMTRNQQQSIYMEGYKGIRNNVTSHQVPFKIFDTLSDPAEKYDLAALPEGDPRKVYFDQLHQKMKDEVLRLRRPHPDAKRAYDSELVPALAAGDKAIGDTKVYRYEGDWDWTPRFNPLDAISSDTVDAVSEEHLSRAADAGLLYKGVIHADKSGRYTFQTESDGGVIFKLHKALVIDNDYKIDGSSASGSILLEAGYHPYSLYYRTGEGAPKLKFTMQGPAK